MILLCALTTAATLVAGHIELDQPTVRYANLPSEVNKSCPCGGGDGDQLCGGGVTSDDNRDEGRVTTVAPGSTIEVKWRETVGHSGRFRVAFDDDGADLADFNAGILGDIPDPSDGGGDRSMTVTLPDIECDHCTLQLIQDMNGDTADEVTDPTGDRTYFQCADMKLEKGAPTSLGGGCAGTSPAPLGALLPLLLTLFRGSRRRAR